MAKILFITATVKEMKAALGSVMVLPKLEQSRVVATERRNDLDLLVTGIGIVNTAYSLGRAVSLKKYDSVIMAGVAGSFDLSKLPLCTGCIIKTEIWPEYGLKVGDVVSANDLGFPLAETESGKIWDRIDLAEIDKLGKSKLDQIRNLPKAISLTVSSVTASEAGNKRYKEFYNADVENMEGFAAGYVCAIEGIDFIQLRSVSNLVGSRKKEDWDLKGAFKTLGAMCPDLIN